MRTSVKIIGVAVLVTVALVQFANWRDSREEQEKWEAMTPEQRAWKVKDDAARAAARAKNEAQAHDIIPKLSMSAWMSEDGLGGCTLSVYLYNGYAETIEAFAGDVTLESESGDTMSIASFLIRYVDPSKNAAEHLPVPDLRDCRQVRRAILRTISACKIGGSLYRDCIKLVKVMDNPENLLALR